MRICQPWGPSGASKTEVMNRLLRLLISTFILLALYGGAMAQYYTKDPYMNEARPISGTPYKTGRIRVYLTDEETGGPYANKEVRIRFYWKWDVKKPTPQTENMSNIRYFEVKATSNEKGFVLVPAMTTYPVRPELPGAEVSAPYFYSIGMIAHDEKHSTGMSIFQPGYDLTDGNGDVRRTVMLYPRPTKPPVNP